MNRVLVALAAAVPLLGVVGCGNAYEIAAAPGFVRVEHRSQDPYDWRAIAPDGVAVAMRVVALRNSADLSFWTRALILRMREMDGYALISSRDVRSMNHTPGTELVFGHDESGKPFVYRVRLFLTTRRLFLIEAGGEKDLMERYATSIDWMLANVRVN
jgi:hypothetical protein